MNKIKYVFVNPSHEKVYVSKGYTEEERLFAKLTMPDIKAATVIFEDNNKPYEDLNRMYHGYEFAFCMYQTGIDPKDGIEIYSLDAPKKKSRTERIREFQQKQNQKQQRFKFS